MRQLLFLQECVKLCWKVRELIWSYGKFWGSTGHCSWFSFPLKEKEKGKLSRFQCLLLSTQSSLLNKAQKKLGFRFFERSHTSITMRRWEELPGSSSWNSIAKPRIQNKGGALHHRPTFAGEYLRTRHGWLRTSWIWWNQKCGFMTPIRIRGKGANLNGSISAALLEGASHNDAGRDGVERRLSEETWRHQMKRNQSSRPRFLDQKTWTRRLLYSAVMSVILSGLCSNWERSWSRMS